MLLTVSDEYLKIGIYLVFGFYHLVLNSTTLDLLISSQAKFLLPAFPWWFRFLHQQALPSWRVRCYGGS